MGGVAQSNEYNKNKYKNIFFMFIKKWLLKKGKWKMYVASMYGNIRLSLAPEVPVCDR